MGWRASAAGDISSSNSNFSQWIPAGYMRCRWLQYILGSMDERFRCRDIDGVHQWWYMGSDWKNDWPAVNSEERRRWLRPGQSSTHRSFQHSTGSTNAFLPIQVCQDPFVFLTFSFASYLPSFIDINALLPVFKVPSHLHFDNFAFVEEWRRFLDMPQMPLGFPAVRQYLVSHGFRVWGRGCFYTNRGRDTNLGCGDISPLYKYSPSGDELSGCLGDREGGGEVSQGSELSWAKLKILDRSKLPMVSVADQTGGRVCCPFVAFLWCCLQFPWLYLTRMRNALQHWQMKRGVNGGWSGSLFLW